MATRNRGDARTAGELESRLEVLRGELQDINNEWQDRRFSDEVRSRWNELVTERDEVAAQLEEVNKRTAYLERLAENPDPANSESPDDRWKQRNMALVDRGPELSKAMRTLEREVERTDNFFADGSDGKIIEEHLRSGDPMHLDARYVAAAGSEPYRRAFGKYLARGERRMDFAELDRDERMAVHEVHQIESLRAMQSGVRPLAATASRSRLIRASGSVRAARCPRSGRSRTWSRRPPGSGGASRVRAERSSSGRKRARRSRAPRRWRSPRSSPRDGTAGSRSRSKPRATTRTSRVSS